MKLNKRQKIILVIVVGVIMIASYLYIDIKENNLWIEQEEQLEIENSENTKENISENTINKEEKEKETIKVHVSGAVNKEGIVELVVDSRIADAIEEAEGLKENACMDEINLAYKLEDGMKVHIPTNEEQEYNNSKNTIDSDKYITKAEESNMEVENNNKNVEAKVNINIATQTELETLPGIGPSTALKIINYRKENGKFTTIEELKEVSGIGDSKYNQIKDLVTI